MGLFDVIEEVHAIQRDHSKLFNVLCEFLPESREKPLPGPRDWLPASSMGTLCPKAHVMAWRMGYGMAIKNFDVQQRWAIDRGTAFHRIFQELWMGPMGWMYGGWRCPKCGHLHTKDSEKGKPEKLIEGWMSPVTPKNSVLMPETCETCEYKSSKFDPFRFEEPWCRNYSELVRGPCDGILKLPAQALEFFDLKTTTSLFYLRDEPRLKDVIQLHWYMDTYDIRKGRLIYVNPGAKKFCNAMVEHEVVFDTKLMTREKKKIRDLREALEDKTRPVPACPHGGKLPFGDCECIKLEMQWSRHGHRPLVEEHRDHDPDRSGSRDSDADDQDRDRAKG